MTYRWEPTAPLDRILETGFKRMDEAVEGVIERLAPSAPIKVEIIRACIICGKRQEKEWMSFCEDLGCSGRVLPIKKPPLFKERINIGMEKLANDFMLGNLKAGLEVLENTGADAQMNTGVGLAGPRTQRGAEHIFNNLRNN